MIENYPDDLDVQEVILHVPFGNVRNFFKKRGILYVVNNRSDIAAYCSRLFLGSDDYEEIKGYTDSPNNYKKISGIEIVTETDLQGISTKLADKKGTIFDEKSKLIIKEVTYNKVGPSLDCVIYYQTNKPGMVDLLRKEERECKFKIEEKEGRKIILTHHQKNEDYAKIIETINNISQDLEESEKILPQEITLERLPIPKRIEFFDRLISYDFDEWRLESVVSIKIRKSDQLEEEEIPELELRGISEAALKGVNLRTNKIVKKFEKSGYYFSGTTVKLMHKTEPLKIQTEILFKSKPELPEIHIKGSVEIIDDMEIKKILPGDVQDKYLKDFWSILEGTYFKIIDELAESDS